MQISAWEMRAVVDCLVFCADHHNINFGSQYLTDIASKFRDELDGIQIEVHHCDDAHSSG